MLEWAEMVKLAALLTLFGALFLSFPTALSPFRNEPTATLTAAVSAFFRTVILVIGLAAWELAQPKLRLRAVAGPALTAMVLSLTAILYGITLGR